MDGRRLLASAKDYNKVSLCNTAIMKKTVMEIIMQLIAAIRLS